MTALHILAYASVVVFVVAVAARAIRLATTPVHLRWELYPVAHEKDRVRYGGSYFEEVDWWTKPRARSLFGELKVMVPEILFLKGVWEHNRALWWWSFPMHIGLYLVIGFIALVIVGAIAGTATPLGTLIGRVGPIVGWVGYILGVLGSVGIFVRRMVEHKLRSFTPPAAYFNLIFLIALFASGVLVLGTVERPFSALSEFVRGLFGAAGGAAAPSAITLHLIVGLLFTLYLPFTHMTHFFTKYFTYHQVRWNDEPNLPGSKLERQIEKQLGYPVSWSAPHIKGDGKKTWGDVATTEVE